MQHNYFAMQHIFVENFAFSTFTITYGNICACRRPLTTGLYGSNPAA
jgi:hypothetical protein